jgi:gas vesicle protein
LKSLENNPPKDKAFAFARTRLLKADISIIKEKLSKFKNDSELATTNDASSEDKQRKQKLEKQLQHFKNQLKEIQSNPNVSAVSFFSYSRTLKNEIAELEEKIRSIK